MTERTEFDLSPLFAGDDDPRILEERKEREEASYAFINKWKDRDDHLSDPDRLKEALDEYENWQRRFGAGGDEEYYFWLRAKQDAVDPAVKAGMNKAIEATHRIANDIAFFELRLAKVPKATQELFLEAEVLKPYRAFLRRLFKRARYDLSEKEERIMTLMSAPSRTNWTRMVSGFLAKEEREIVYADGRTGKVSMSDLVQLMNNEDKNVRDRAAAAFNDILARYAEVAEHELNSVLLSKKIDDELRGCERPDSSRHAADNIGTEVVDALVSAVSGRNGIAQQFYRVKAKLVGIERLEYHERNLQYGAVNRDISYEEGSALVHRILMALDPDLDRVFEELASKGQIDVYPRKGKAGGAFCIANLLAQPTYVFLNYTNDLQSVMVLAHEMGHAINDELCKRTCHALDFGTSTATAEVASTFMQDFVLKEIENGADDETRLAVMIMRLNDVITSVFRQVSLYRFEEELHREFRAKGYLPKEEIGAIFQKHMASYMGESVIQSPGSENWWVYWMHIRQFFYVYSYASGALIANAMRRELQQDPAFISRVKDFLSSGLSDTPEGIFMQMGIDISKKEFWDRGLDEIEELLAEAAALAEKVRGKGAVSDEGAETVTRPA